MKLKEFMANIASHFAPLTLLKAIHPVQELTNTVYHTNKNKSPWLNADEIELTQEDFAAETSVS